MFAGTCEPYGTGGTHAGWVAVCIACHNALHDVG